jgi:hypothetical protein
VATFGAQFFETCAITGHSRHALAMAYAALSSEWWSPAHRRASARQLAARAEFDTETWAQPGSEEPLSQGHKVEISWVG